MAIAATLSMDGVRSTEILTSLLGSVANTKPVELSIMAKMQGSVIGDASILSGPVQSTLSVDPDDNED